MPAFDRDLGNHPCSIDHEIGDFADHSVARFDTVAGYRPRAAKMGIRFFSVSVGSGKGAATG